MEKTKPAGSSALEPFLLLLKDARGAGAVSVISQALDTAGVFGVGELLDLPHVQDLAEGPYASFFRLLMLFACGTYNDYKAEKGGLPELSPAQLRKLQLLTVVTLAMKHKCLQYSYLQAQLEIPDVRQLEDLIIEGLTAGLFCGKLDQQYQQVELYNIVGRDLSPSNMASMKTELLGWAERCQETLTMIKTQIDKAKANSEIRQKKELELMVARKKKSIGLASGSILGPLAAAGSGRLLNISSRFVGGQVHSASSVGPVHWILPPLHR
ncbi:COP9 signalosome complex subunit 7a-like isoform X3 [Babylonia areolata]|uniref:COP9 signalosome complex subunit 7a-like isoform X3 n=1 Tax=Babylonia areolata TaxID=304850 RepID=UPI003FD5792F